MAAPSGQAARLLRSGIDCVAPDTRDGSTAGACRPRLHDGLLPEARVAQMSSAAVAEGVLLPRSVDFGEPNDAPVLALVKHCQRVAVRDAG